MLSEATDNERHHPTVRSKTVPKAVAKGGARPLLPRL